MPRPLTALAVTNAKPDPRRRLEITDGANPGLRLVVQPSGSKSFVFRYEAGGRSNKLTLGPAAGPGALSLAEAREHAAKARKILTAGLDPIAERKAARVADAARLHAERRAVEAAARREDDLIERVMDVYFERKVAGMKSGHEVKRLLEKEVKGVWKGRLVTEIERRDVVKLIDAIADRGAGTTANRTLANVRAFYGWCVRRGIVQVSPCVGIDRPKAEVQRDRVLTDPELRLLWLALQKLEWPWRQFFCLALLTGQRREEVAGLRWDELDLSEKEPAWTLPRTRTKNGNEHVVPLAPTLVALLQDLPRIEGSDFAFTTTGNTSISGFSRAKATLDATILKIAKEEAAARGEDPAKIGVLPWRLHDLRRTAATRMADLGVLPHVVEAVLNHISGHKSGVAGIYNRATYLPEKRRALELWTAHLQTLTADVTDGSALRS